MEIEFQKLKVTDLPLMHKWLNTPSVIEWYGKKDSAVEAIEKKYLPRIEGKDPTNSYIIYIEDYPIGYIQAYKVEDYPEYANLINAGAKSAGIDLFIGEPDYLHKGLGSKILKIFLAQIVFVDKDITQAVVDPEPKNKVAIRAYEKVGFKYLKTISLHKEDESAYLMVINASDFKTQ